MESNLAQLISRVLYILIVALITTVLVYLGSWILRRKLTGAQFWTMFGVSCLVWLILIFLASST
jgi:membrane-bound ClpP family serine protease